MSLADAVRTRMYVVDRTAADDVGRAHSQISTGSHRGLNVVVVAGLIDLRLFVEIEVDAYQAAQ